jgi:AcrR family transcriptional regulator
MGRWAPDARGRLEQAAMELYGERGFELTTVAEIAARAGLTERTFFRHFDDKREVLFSGGSALREFLVGHVDAQDPSVPPFEAVTAALGAASDGFFEERRAGVRYRQAIIEANPELQERELIKLASLASALAEALRRRGVADPTAGLAAEAGMAVFRVAFESWVHDEEGAPLSDRIRMSADDLKRMTGGRQQASRR